MKSILQSMVLTRNLGNKFFFSCSFYSRCVPVPVFRCSLFDHLRFENHNCDFCTNTTFEFEHLLTRPEVQEYFQFISDEYDKYTKKENFQSPVLTFISEVKNYENYIKNLKTLSENSNEELNELVKNEEEQCRNRIKENYRKILTLAFPEDYDDDKSVTMEISPGVGGTEAKLFAEELFEMYLKYIDFKSWNIDYKEKSSSDNGGINKGEVQVSGESVFGILRHEAGIHRVQRIPKTEKAGKMQTSTCKVVVIPDTNDSKADLNRKDLKFETKLSSGPGGQNVQKSETCVKITHLPTGLSVECQEERYQLVNKKIALKRLKNLLYQTLETEKVLKDNELKKKQAATVLRSDKIRTYNFSQNRVTDHRINHTIHNVKLFMEGTNSLNEMILLLDASHRKELLLKNLARILKEKNVDEIFSKDAIKL